MFPYTPWCSLPCLTPSLTHTTPSLISGWCLMLFPTPSPQLLPVCISAYPSFLEGRVGPGLSQLEDSVGGVDEAILFNPHVPVQGHMGATASPAWWHRAGQDETQTQKRYPGNLQGKPVLGLLLLLTKRKHWLF